MADMRFGPEPLPDTEGIKTLTLAMQ